MNNKTAKLTKAAMITAIIFLLGLTPLGYPTIPPIALTVVMVPVAIGSVMLGPVYGIFFGVCFGITSILHAFMVPTPTSPLFYNPLISVVPRIIVGILPYYVYKIFPKGGNGKKCVAGFAAGLSAAIINTVLVLGSLYLFKGADAAAAFGVSQTTLGITLLGVATANGIPEAIVSGILTSAVVTALQFKKKEA